MTVVTVVTGLVPGLGFTANAERDILSSGTTAA